MNKRSTTQIAALLITVALAAFALTSCGGDDDGQSEAAAARSTASGSDATLPEPIAADTAKRVDLKDRLLARITMPSPDWMVLAFGSLWVKQDDGGVVRVEPETGKVIAEIRSDVPGGQHGCQGIGAGGDAVWSCPPGVEVERFDPETNSLAATVRIDKLPDQGRLVSAADHVWVLTDGGAKLTGIDERSNKPSTTLKLGASCVDLAAEGTTLWAMCPPDDRVLRIDAKTGEVTDELELAGATNAAVGDHVWIGFEGGVAEVDPETLEVLAVYEVHPRYGGSIYVTPDAVWVREEGDVFLARIDPQAQQIVETIEAPGLPSGGDVVQIGDSVWVTAYDDDTLAELSTE